MYKKSLMTPFVIWLVIFAFSSCQRGMLPSIGRNETFHLDNSCISLKDSSREGLFPGVIWYKEAAYSYLERKGEPGLHWIENDGNHGVLLSLNPVVMYSTSPNGQSAIFMGDDYIIYLLEGTTVRQISSQSDWLGNSLVWAEKGKILGTDWDFQESRISVITTDLETGIVSRYDHFDGGVSSEPMPKIARNGILAYLWYSNFEGPRLVVYDTRNEREIARYKDINYEIRPSWYGFLLNPEGTRILSISTPLGEGYDGMQQELFEVEIGKAPVQVTNFHEKYPYFLIYDLNFGGQRWSPDNRWVVIDAIPSESRVTDSTTATDYIFLVDLENRIAYPFCEPVTGDDYVAWSPDSRYFALSIGDKLWVVNPKTRESRLLIERPGIPLQVLGWTIP